MQTRFFNPSSCRQGLITTNYTDDKWVKRYRYKDTLKHSFEYIFFALQHILLNESNIHSVINSMRDALLFFLTCTQKIPGVDNLLEVLIKSVCVYFFKDF